MTIHLTAHLFSPAGALLLGLAASKVACTVWDSTAWLVGAVRDAVTA